MTPTLQSLLEFLRVSSLFFLTGIGVTAVYDVGKRAGIEFTNSNTVGTLNGAACAGITFCFSFPFNESATKDIPRQWRMANSRGKLFILCSSLIAFTTTGIANCYYMTGNTGFKIIALVMPGFAARDIFTNWILHANLAINRYLRKKHYQQAYQSFKLLSILLNNLQTNVSFKNALKKADTQENKMALSLLEAYKSHRNNKECFADDFQEALQNLLQLIDAHDEKESLIIVTHFQQWGRYGYLLDWIKLLGLSGVGGAAGYSLYYLLGPEAGRCIFGSGMAFYYDANTKKTICPNTSEFMSHTGTALGYSMLAMQTGVATFPLVVLFNTAWASIKNPWTWKNILVYIPATIFAVFRSSISAYIESQNSAGNPELGWLIYDASVFFCFHFFSIAMGGPATIKTLYHKIASPILDIGHRWWNYCCCRKAYPEKQPLMTTPEPSVSISTVTTATKYLRELCLFVPNKINRIFSGNFIGSTDQKSFALQ